MADGAPALGTSGGEGQPMRSERAMNERRIVYPDCSSITATPIQQRRYSNADTATPIQQRR
jgi:hypothetical protein